MAIQYDSGQQVLALAKAVINASAAIKLAFTLAEQVGRNNSINDPSWAELDAADPAGYTDVLSADGLLLGLQVTPMEVSNALGSINVFRDYYTGNNPVGASAWGNNIEAVAPPVMNTNVQIFSNPLP